MTFALAAVGYVGFGASIGFAPAGAMVAQITWDTLSSYSLSVLPLFVDIPRVGVVLILIAFYLVFGCVFDSLAMILLTIPVFFPLVQQLGFDPIWFGILVVVVVEISLITLPIGMNIFVIRSVTKDLPTTTIYKGVLPFILADVVRLTLIVLCRPWCCSCPIR